MKKFILAILLMIISISTLAGEVDPLLEPMTAYNCTLPVEREDGEPFDYVAEGKEVHFYWGYASGDYQFTEVRPDCQWIIDNTGFQVGTTIYLVATVWDTDDRESGYSSPEMTHTIIKPVKPSKPPGAGYFEPYVGGGN